ncbi:MAG: sugar phosphate nucleotidyltransferase [Elusimicrobiota bacterium]
MQAIILAGGKGTRLRPFTISLPKPLVPLGEYPIIEILLRQLSRQGFRDVVISTGHLAGLIEAYCGNGKKWKLRIRYSREDKPLNTAGCLGMIRGLKPHFLVVNGDILTDLSFAQLYRQHLKQRSWATVGVVPRESEVDYGVIELGPGSTLAKYIEKPRLPYLVSMGVNVFDRRAVKLIKKGESIGIPDFILRLKAGGKKVYCRRSAVRWLDIGRPDDYQTAQDLFERDSKSFLHAKP